MVVASQNTQRIVIFDSAEDGSVDSWFGGQGPADTQFRQP